MREKKRNGAGRVRAAPGNLGGLARPCTLFPGTSWQKNLEAKNLEAKKKEGLPEPA